MAPSGIKGDGGLERMIAGLQAMGDVDVAGVAAPAIDRYVRAELAARKQPGGAQWPKKQSGEPALDNAWRELEVRISGRAVILRVRGRHAFHHFGAQEKPARKQLPEGRMPPRLGDAIRAGLVEPFKAATKAGKRGYAYYRGRGINPRSVR